MLTGSKTLKLIPRDLQDLPGAGQQVERWNMKNLEKGIAIALGCLANDETQNSQALVLNTLSSMRDVYSHCVGKLEQLIKQVSRRLF